MNKVDPIKRDGNYICPDCGHDAFRRGPGGALSMNVECAGCETRWNANGLGFPWERLSTVWERLEEKHGPVEEKR